MGTPLEQVGEMRTRLKQLGMAFQAIQDDNRRLEALSGVGSAMTRLIQALTASQTAMTEALKKDEGKAVTLICNKGIGKPDKFTGKGNESFSRWKSKWEAFIYSIFAELEDAKTNIEKTHCRWCLRGTCNRGERCKFTCNEQQKKWARMAR